MSRKRNRGISKRGRPYLLTSASVSFLCVCTDVSYCMYSCVLVGASVRVRVTSYIGQTY